MSRFREIACCCAGMLLLGTGCVFNSREVTVSKDESIRCQREYFRNELTSHDGLALESENFLRGNLILDDLGKNPQMVLRKISEYHQISGDPKYLIIAADLCRYLASKCDERERLKYHLSNFYYCTSFMRNQEKEIEKGTGSYSIFNFTTTQCVQDYNEACCGIFAFLNQRNLLDANAISLQDVSGRKYVMVKPVFNLSVPREAIENFSLCASYTVKNLMQVNRRPGVGVPLVAKVKRKKWYNSLITPAGMTIPVTLIIKREEGADGEIVLRLIFLDTSIQESFHFRGNKSNLFQCPMALDFSTPLACFLNEVAERNLLSQMLNPLEQEASDGLYMVEPYQPGKIPVVFIHGLLSSPETWVQMINSLKNNPEIRQRYQFWFFSYSTGAPVVLSAQKLRNALFAAQKEFCTTPEATKNFNKMVLVGHSMGGLLTRLMVQKDQEYLFGKILNTSMADAKKKLQPEDYKCLDSFIPYPLPFVHRVVFMAVPHKGADMAKTPIAKLGIKLIKLPTSLLSREESIKRIIRALNPAMATSMGTQNRFFTGIDNLDPENRIVLALGSSPMKEDLIYHCVIGHKSNAGVPGGSDGVVPYWSSHLDNAASELVVDSDHSVHRKPAAIQELLRILLLHLKSSDQK